MKRWRRYQSEDQAIEERAGDIKATKTPRDERFDNLETIMEWQSWCPRCQRHVPVYVGTAATTVPQTHYCSRCNLWLYSTPGDSIKISEKKSDEPAS